MLKLVEMVQSIEETQLTITHERRQDVTLTPSLLIQRGSAHSSSLASSQHHHAEYLHCHLCSHHYRNGGHRGLDESFTCEPESHSGHSCGHNISLCVDNLPLVETKANRLKAKPQPDEQLSSDGAGTQQEPTEKDHMNLINKYTSLASRVAQLRSPSPGSWHRIHRTLSTSSFLFPTTIHKPQLFSLSCLLTVPSDPTPLLGLSSS
ncbi:hypothetical protein LEMLEM_LOCUS7859 [Lemmus lemmus]